MQFKVTKFCISQGLTQVVKRLTSELDSSFSRRKIQKLLEKKSRTQMKRPKPLQQKEFSIHFGLNLRVLY